MVSNSELHNKWQYRYIRQFRIANPEWFDSQEGIEKLQNVLNNFLESKLFKDIMHVYDVWKIDSEPVFFPITNY